MISNIKLLMEDVKQFREDRTGIYRECIQNKLDKSNDSYLEELKNAEKTFLQSDRLDRVVRGKVSR